MRDEGGHILPPSIRESLESYESEPAPWLAKTLREMSTDKLRELLAKAIDPWPFGTIVRHLGASATAMVLIDNGTSVEVLLLGNKETALTGREVWDPVEFPPK